MKVSVFSDRTPLFYLECSRTGLKYELKALKGITWAPTGLLFILSMDLRERRCERSDFKMYAVPSKQHYTKGGAEGWSSTQTLSA